MSLRSRTLLSLAWLLAIGLCAAASSRAQDALFRVEASAAGLSAPAHTFGCAEGAAAGLDAYDLPEPPAPPADYLALVFRIGLPDVPLPDRYRDDIRAPEDLLGDEIEVWELHVETDHVGATAHVTVGALSSPSSPVRLRVIGEGLDLALPGAFDVTLDGPETTLWLELTPELPIGSTPAGWGDLKRAYAR